MRQSEMLKKALLWLGGVSCMLLIAACGGDGDGASTKAPQTTVSARVAVHQ